MNNKRWAATILAIFVCALFLAVAFAGAPPASSAVSLQITPTGPIASPEEIEAARLDWSASAHAETFDKGLGANTTCARCKSPLNWDPTQELAQIQAMDCTSCKRLPGAPRPELESGIPVPEPEWHQISCEICHVPAGDSYYKEIAFWNQRLGIYEPVEEEADLCAHCHEGRHGFRVIEEQEETEIHHSMSCSDCHGSHGEPSACTDCHNPTSGAGSQEHSRHPSVNCSGCHDQGGLSVWHDDEPGSKHIGEYITLRFAHTLTSWPSHNLSTDIECRRCHHPVAERTAVLVPYVGCDECHDHPEGAVSEWCIFFPRDEDPNANKLTQP